jgi:hypothetical protein
MKQYLKMAIFWVVVACSLVHDATTQKTVIFIFAAART